MTTAIDPILGFTFPDGTVQSVASNKGFDYLQTWKEYSTTTERFTNTLFSNSSTKPIAINLGVPTSRTAQFTVIVNGVIIGQAYCDSVGGNREMMGLIIVGPGGTYQVNGSTPSKWYELR